MPWKSIPIVWMNNYLSLILSNCTFKLFQIFTFCLCNGFNSFFTHFTIIKLQFFQRRHFKFGEKLSALIININLCWIKENLQKIISISFSQRFSVNNLKESANNLFLFRVIFIKLGLCFPKMISKNSINFYSFII